MQIQNTQQSSEHHNDVRYVIPGNPIPLARPRFFNGRVYDSQKQVKFATGIIIRHQHGDRPKYEGPLHLNVNFFMKPPKKNINTWHTNTPDLDNMLKFIADVSIGILYEDDKNIAKITTCKIYDNDPRVEFTLTPLQH